MQPAALPAPDEPGTWDDLTQPNNPRTDPAPVPPPPDHRAPGRSPQGRLRRRCAAGLRPVLDLPARSPQTSAAIGETGDASHACPRRAATTQTPQFRRP